MKKLAYEAELETQTTLPDGSRARGELEQMGPWKVIENGRHGRGLVAKNLTKNEARVIAAALNNLRREEEAEIPF